MNCEKNSTRRFKQSLVYI